MLFCMASCSDNTYLNAIPAESTALISIDPVKMSGINNVAVLKTLLHVTNMVHDLQMQPYHYVLIMRHEKQVHTFVNLNDNKPSYMVIIAKDKQ